MVFYILPEKYFQSGATMSACRNSPRESMSYTFSLG